MKKFSLALLCTLLLGLMSAGASVKFEEGSLDDLRAKAQKTEKLVFIDLYATWCGPCKMMERDVFSREDVGRFMSDNFVAGKYDVDKYVGYKLSERFKVTSIPTYIIIDTNSNVVGRMQGAMPAEEFIENIKTILKNRK